MKSSTSSSGQAATAFGIRVDGETRLVLPSRDVAAEIHEMEQSEQTYFARWEPWAAKPMTPEATFARLEQAMLDFAVGRRVPTYVEWRGRIVGSVNARIEAWSEAAELGYYLAQHAQGRGLVTRSATTLIDHLILARGLERVYVQAAVDNTASGAVAARLGLVEEGTLRSAWSVGGTRVDATVHATTRGRWIAERDRTGAGGPSA